MLLHIGENRFVPGEAIVAIVPAENVSRDTERLIRDCVEIGHYYPSYARPKAYVITARGTETFVYAAATGMETLRERIKESKNGIAHRAE
ncbi:MAG: DUF370 domain-containing protein [Clostridia bacterium]|nr:DUF370 domain-containing protein [Clostridia bacterium]